MRAKTRAYLPPHPRVKKSRRAAQRQGLRPEKSRRRDPRATDYGECRIVNAYNNTVEADGGYLADCEMNLDDAERYLRAGVEA
jgi:hypothetical protein